MAAIGLAMLLGFAGTMLGALWTFVLGLAGAPGALLGQLSPRMRSERVVPGWALAITVVGQSYAALCFGAFIIKATRFHLFGDHGPGSWVAWAVAFMVSQVPALAAAKDSAAETERGVQHFATPFTLTITTIGFPVLALSAPVMNSLWGWVPRI